MWKVLCLAFLLAIGLLAFSGTALLVPKPIPPPQTIIVNKPPDVKLTPEKMKVITSIIGILSLQNAH